MTRFHPFVRLNSIPSTMQILMQSQIPEIQKPRTIMLNHESNVKRKSSLQLINDRIIPISHSPWTYLGGKENVTYLASSSQKVVSSDSHGLEGSGGTRNGSYSTYCSV